MSPKGPPFKFLNILQQNECSKNPKRSPFYIFRHYAIISSYLILRNSKALQNCYSRLQARTERTLKLWQVTNNLSQKTDQGRIEILPVRCEKIDLKAGPQ